MTLKGDGTTKSGYVPPQLGPFKCGHCAHFDGRSHCDHPEVIADPEVRGLVASEGCCNYYHHIEDLLSQIRNTK